MDSTKLQGAIQSRTNQWLITGLVAYLVKHLGLPSLPDDVSTEVVSVISMALDALIPVAMAAGIWFRIKARKIISGLF